MENCLFCKIINKEIPSEIIFENDRVVAFKDIHPAAPVHILIVPKEHIADANALNESNAAYIMDIHLAAKNIAKQLGIDQKGYRLINNCGADAGQTVMHLHYHLIGGINMGEKLI